MPSAVWDLCDALVDLFNEALDVPVFDGPVSRTTLPKTYVFVGSDGGDAGTGEDATDAMTADQEWADIGGGRRLEVGEITCAVWAWSGSKSFPPVRSQVESVLDTIEATLKANRAMPGVLTGGTVGMSRVSIRQRHVEEGAVVRAVFTVGFRSLLT